MRENIRMVTLHVVRTQQNSKAQKKMTTPQLFSFTFFFSPHRAHYVSVDQSPLIYCEATENRFYNTKMLLANNLLMTYLVLNRQNVYNPNILVIMISESDCEASIMNRIDSWPERIITTLLTFIHVKTQHINQHMRLNNQSQAALCFLFTLDLYRKTYNVSCFFFPQE